MEKYVKALKFETSGDLCEFCNKHRIGRSDIISIEHLGVDAHRMFFQVDECTLDKLNYDYYKHVDSHDFYKV